MTDIEASRLKYHRSCLATKFKVQILGEEHYPTCFDWSKGILLMSCKAVLILVDLDKSYLFWKIPLC